MLLMAGAFSAISQDSNGKELTSKQSAIVSALDARNFKAAKDEIKSFLPLLKKEQRLLQKSINQVGKKATSDLDIDFLKNQYVERNDLYKRLEKVLDVSPSALRVRAEKVSNDLKSFSFEEAVTSASLAGTN